MIKNTTKLNLKQTISFLEQSLDSCFTKHEKKSCEFNAPVNKTDKLKIFVHSPYSYNDEKNFEFQSIIQLVNKNNNIREQIGYDNIKDAVNDVNRLAKQVIVTKKDLVDCLK